MSEYRIEFKSVHQLCTENPHSDKRQQFCIWSCENHLWKPTRYKKTHTILCEMISYVVNNCNWFPPWTLIISNNLHCTIWKNFRICYSSHAVSQIYLYNGLRFMCVADRRQHNIRRGKSIGKKTNNARTV